MFEHKYMYLNSHVATDGCPTTEGKLSELFDMMQVTRAQYSRKITNLDKMVHFVINDKGMWTAARDKAQSDGRIRRNFNFQNNTE